MKKIQEAIEYIRNLAVMVIFSFLAALTSRRTWFWVAIVLLFAGFVIGWLWVCSRVRFG